MAVTVSPRRTPLTKPVTGSARSRGGAGAGAGVARRSAMRERIRRMLRMPCHVLVMLLVSSRGREALQAHLRRRAAPLAFVCPPRLNDDGLMTS